MKTLFLKLTAIVFFVSVLVTGCKKDVLDNPQPLPSKPTEFGVLKFVIDTNLNTGTYHSSNLAAVVTITNDKNVEVIKEKVLKLEIGSNVTAESVQLPVGNYKLTYFRMVYAATSTHFAIPITGSAKAGLVQKPLAMDLKVEKDKTGEVSLQVVKVKKGDRSEDFGYPVGTFNNNQSEVEPYVKIKVRAAVKIGDVMYDSIAAALSIRTYNENGEMTFKSLSLKAGTDEIALLRSAARYEITVSKWGSDYTLNLNKNEVSEETVYIIGGNKAAKKLTSEITLDFINGKYVAKSKAAYFYDGAGNITEIKHYLKRSDNTPYLAITDQFEYSGGRVAKISSTNEKNAVVNLTSFTYDNAGRVSKIYNKENGQETYATVDYYSGSQDITIHHTFPGQIYNKDYYQRFLNGNMFESSYISNFDHNELGSYYYDDQINPYVHINLPNLFLSNRSKNNVITQNGSYPGGYRNYISSYTYDNEGYPTELIRKFSSNNQTSTTKTVYTY